jgi:hypothetical protein
MTLLPPVSWPQKPKHEPDRIHRNEHKARAGDDRHLRSL